jgi:hypothetical protein
MLICHVRKTCKLKHGLQYIYIYIYIYIYKQKQEIYSHKQRNGCVHEKYKKKCIFMDVSDGALQELDRVACHSSSVVEKSKDTVTVTNDSLLSYHAKQSCLRTHYLQLSRPHTYHSQSPFSFISEGACVPDSTFPGISLEALSSRTAHASSHSLRRSSASCFDHLLSSADMTDQFLISNSSRKQPMHTLPARRACVRLPSFWLEHNETQDSYLVARQLE